MSQDVVSFVLRFVREAGEAQQVRWRGLVRHVQRNTEQSFTQFAEALAFMQAQVNDVAQGSAGQADAAAGANPFLETARLWGETMPQMTRLMQESVQQLWQGGTAVNEQMQQMAAAALAAWGMPAPQEQRQALARVAELTAQLEAMTAKVAALQAQVAALKQ